jgi:hypothetical protein
MLSMRERDNSSLVTLSSGVPLNPRETRAFNASFFMEPPVPGKRKALSVVLAVTDQYGRTHRTPNITLDYRGDPGAPEA